MFCDDGGIFCFQQERFWMLIQRDVGLIPEHIMNILDFCGYSANCALEAINDEKLKIIEREAKGECGGWRAITNGAY